LSFAVTDEIDGLLVKNRSHRRLRGYLHLLYRLYRAPGKRTKYVLSNYIKPKESQKSA
jgi:hypothetical protein